MDNRDFRVRCNLCFPPEKEGVARGLITALKNQMDKAVNINSGEFQEEIGFVSLERCGHRLGIMCDFIEEYKVK